MSEQKQPAEVGPVELVLGPALSPAAWQERQKLSNDSWTHWYECQPFPRSAPRDFMIGQIPAQRRILQTEDQTQWAVHAAMADLRAANANLFERVQMLEAAEEGAKEAFGVVVQEKHDALAECKRLRTLLDAAYADLRRARIGA